MAIMLYEIILIGYWCIDRCGFLNMADNKSLVTNFILFTCKTVVNWLWFEISQSKLYKLSIKSWIRCFESSSHFAIIN